MVKNIYYPFLLCFYLLFFLVGCRKIPMICGKTMMMKANINALEILHTRQNRLNSERKGNHNKPDQQNKNIETNKSQKIMNSIA